MRTVHETADGLKPRSVTIVMPALDEEAHIETAIRSVLVGTEAIDCDLVVADGGSTDRTREIVRRLQSEDPRIRLVHNEKRVQSAAVNLVARLCEGRSRYLVRADCHSRYPAGFVAGCITTLERVGAASVVVPMRTIGSRCMQRAIAAAQNSRIGNGGSPHRIEGRSRFVDHGHHAAFDLRTFLDVGGYDERFSHNEDAELDLRLVKAGQRIYLDADNAIDYFPRATLRALARQYLNFGWGRANTLLRHRTAPRLRQVAPIVVLCLNSLGLTMAWAYPWALALPSAYLVLLAAWSVGEAVHGRERCRLLAWAAAATMHHAWAIGHLLRLAQHFRGWRLGSRARRHAS